MSWIDDWTGGVWDALTNRLPGLVGDAVKGTATAVQMIIDDVGEMASMVLSIIQRANIERETELQQARLREMEATDMYPPDPDTLAKLVHFGEDHQQYAEQMRRLTGKFKTTLPIYYELTRQPLDPATLRMLWNRGIVDEAYVDKVLRENGFVDQVATFEKAPEGYDFTWTFNERTDRQYLKRLFSVLPAIPDIVRMDVRDAFPKLPGLHPDWVKENPDWRQWARTEGAKVKPLDWPGEGKDITDALKMDVDPYGPQSFASWFLGGRLEYTEAFEKAAKAGGLDPYWAMKYWESHWVIPGFETGRQMLWRVPGVTEELFKSMMRWQDFPPNLIDALTQIAYRPLTRVDVRRMHLEGVLSIAEVFKAYLDFGYHPSNAARMTAFTVVWNMDRTYGKTVDEIVESYSEGVYSLDEAGMLYWEVVGADASEVIPEDVADYLSPEQIESVRVTIGICRAQKIADFQRKIALAEKERLIDWHRETLKTAQKMFVSWEWTPEATTEYLVTLGYESVRIQSLLEKWGPLRQREERLPTQGMLEDFLIEQGMPVEIWSEYMGRLGYSDAIIQQILAGTGKLPTRAMLEKFYVKNLITEDALRSNLRKLGYDAWVITTIVQSLEPEET